MGSLSSPKVTPVRSSNASTGAILDEPAQLPNSPSRKTNGVAARRICTIIPRRELQLIMSYRVQAIILEMRDRIGRRSAKYLWAALALGVGAAALLQSASADEIAAATRVVVHKAEHKLYLYDGNRLLGEYKVQLGLSP